MKQIDKDEESFKQEMVKLTESMVQEALLKEKEMLAKEFYIKFKGLFGRQEPKINEEIRKMTFQ